MTARFIVRLLTEAGVLLAWAEVNAEARPQGRPRSTPFFALIPTMFEVDESGLAHQLSIHWADLDVVRVTKLMEEMPVAPGQILRFDWIEPVWMVEGSKVDIPLPPVTVKRPVNLQPPTGSLQAVAEHV